MAGEMKTNMSRRQLLLAAGVGAGLLSVRPSVLFGAEGGAIEPQPYFAAVGRAIEALAKLGAPMAAADAARIASLARQNNRSAVEAAEQILGRYTLLRITIEADGFPRTVAGAAPAILIEQGWRIYLVRIANPLSNRERLSAVREDERGSWNSGVAGTGAAEQTPLSAHTNAQRPVLNQSLDLSPRIAQSWLTSQLYITPSMPEALSGFPIEYRVIQLFSRDRGQRSKYFNFGLSTSGTFKSWLGNTLSRRGVALNFDCRPSRDVSLRVHDADGRGCMASLVIRDSLDRIYPLQAMRLAPDMPFQRRIYRGDGETVRLPDAEYTVESRRGPEYLCGVQTVRIGEQQNRIEIALQRWIDPAAYGWYSGDPHIHAAGCAHYQTPAEGVAPETMIRQVRGEALYIGDVLNWGTSYYYQKQFFSGHAASPPAGLEHPELQTANNATLQPRVSAHDQESLLRYDLEISGFPSSHAGHLMLLRMREQDYPGTKLVEDWPSWTLPILKWAKAQGAVVGFAHTASGLWVESMNLPNYDIPPFAGVGANEAIVDVAHGVVDFLCGGEVMPATELNFWYHLLNSGYRLAMLGETDFPCISDERPGVGRTYVRLEHPPAGDDGYNAWIDNLQKGRLYFGDGRSHFLAFTVNERASGDADVTLAAPATIEVKATIAAWLEPHTTPATEALRNEPAFAAVGWNLEKARIGKTREVEVELVVNGEAVDRAVLMADGKPQQVHFQVAITRSSWVALRILPSGHTHPVFVTVDNKPVRASRRSAQWCRSCVDKLWEVKSPFMRSSERAAAAAAFDHARAAYDAIIAECDVS